MRIAICKSDLRMNSICRYLCKGHEMISLYPNHEQEIKDEIDVLILPMTGLDLHGNVEGKDGVIYLSNIWKSLKKDGIVFYGIQHSFLETIPQRVYYYMEDANVVKENAILTAQGVLYLILGNIKNSLYEQQIDIIGNGNCGKALATMFENLQLSYRLIRRNAEQNNEINLEDYKKMQTGTIVINTAPVAYFDVHFFKRNHNCQCVIDLASGNVLDIEQLRKEAIYAIKAGNLPVQIAPKSAGKILADYIGGIIRC